MENMSYCRIENTLAALQECEKTLDDYADQLIDLSPKEIEAAEKLFKLCKKLADEWGDN